MFYSSLLLGRISSMINLKQAYSLIFFVWLIVGGFSICSIGLAQDNTVKIQIKWHYTKFPLKAELYSVKPEKKLFISETANVSKLSDSPALKNLDSVLIAEKNGKTPAVLIVKNDTAQDYYFFAVPHTVHPDKSAAGHYFECLCVGRVFIVKAKSIWYRIVRLNLNESFQNLDHFDITHQIIGLTKNDVELNYKDRLYEKE